MSQDEEISNKSESEEDDCENFFLQPALSPYNIADKVQEANELLFNDAMENSNREQRVKFSEDLVDYEPDLTDDDVQSIESYTEADFSIAENHPEELQYIQSNGNCAGEIYDILEEVEDEVDVELVEDEVEVYEEVIELDDVIEDANSLDEVQSISEEEKQPTETRVRPKSAKLKPLPPKKQALNVHIECRNHCIEELETPIESCLNRLAITEIPPCPPLKLYKRKCCENNPIRAEKLPLYTGLRSEYGLSAAQLHLLEKRQEAIRRKEQKRRQLQEEYRKRKIEQNELIFCQWLKDISGTKGKKIPARPKTAAGFTALSPVVVVKKRQRPHTTATCVFIEVPERVLKGGIRIGDLLVTNKNLASKNLHVITCSC